MSRKQLAWVIGFLTVTALAIIGELVAAFDHNPDTPPWTDLIVRYIPAPITYTLIGILIIWLPAHFLTHYADAKRRHTAAALVAPTQTRYPWRATLRTAFAIVVGLAATAPDIAHTLGVEHTPWAVRALAVAAAVTRVMAIPGVDQVLRRYVPWLGSAPVVGASQGDKPAGRPGAARHVLSPDRASPQSVSAPVDKAAVHQADAEHPPDVGSAKPSAS